MLTEAFSQATCITAPYFTLIFFLHQTFTQCGQTTGPVKHPKDNRPKTETKARREKEPNTTSGMLLSVSKGFKGMAGNIYTFKHCISRTNIFFTDIFVKAKVLSNTDPKHGKFSSYTLFAIPLKRKPSRGFDKIKPQLPSKSSKLAFALVTHSIFFLSNLRQDLALGQKVDISGAVLHARNPAAVAARALSSTGPEPLPMAVRCANTRVRDPPLSCRDLAALAPGNSGGLFPPFQLPFTGRCDLLLHKASAQLWGNWLLTHRASTSQTAAVTTDLGYGGQ